MTEKDMADLLASQGDQIRELEKEIAILKLAVPLEEDLAASIDEMLKYLAMEDGYTLNGIARLLVECQRRMAADWLEVGGARRHLTAIQGERSWRCFHCDEVFTDAAEAREHYGADEGKTPACRLPSIDVKRLRELEAESDEWRARALSAEIKAESGEQYYAETMRLTKGHGVFMALDYMEGEKIVLQQRAAQAEADLSTVREALKAAAQFLDPGVDRGPAIDGWDNTRMMVEAALQPSKEGK